MKVIKLMKNKIFAILLLAAILCSAEYNSYFVTADVGVQNETGTGNYSESSQKICYETLIPQREAVIHERKSEGNLEKSSNKKTRNNIVLSIDYIVGCNLQDNTYLQISCRYIGDCDRCTRYIIRYIHNQDGKK